MEEAPRPGSSEVEAVKPLCGWTMPEADARAMLPMIERAITKADGQPQRRAVLRRFHAMLESDLAALATRRMEGE